MMGLLVLGAALISLVAAGPVSAQTTSPATATFSGGLLHVEGGGGADVIRVEYTSSAVGTPFSLVRRVVNGYAVSDTAGVTAGSGCQQVSATMVICGLGGAAAAKVEVKGGAGDDSITFDAGSDFPPTEASGGDGNDSISEVDLGRGDAGNDVITARNRAGSWLYGGSGADELWYTDNASGDAGNDDIRGSHRSGTLRGNSGADFIEAGSRPADGFSYIYGDTPSVSSPSDGDDYIIGTNIRDNIYAGGGADVVRGGGGGDRSEGGDHIYGGPGNDDLSGGGHDGVVEGEDGNDTLNTVNGAVDWSMGCGAGTDKLTKDWIDPLAYVFECETVVSK